MRIWIIIYFLNRKASAFPVIDNVSYAKLYGDRQFDINVHVYASGAIHVTFGLGVVHVTKKGYVLDLLNTFNIESSWRINKTTFEKAEALSTLPVE